MSHQPPEQSGDGRDPGDQPSPDPDAQQPGRDAQRQPHPFGQQAPWHVAGSGFQDGGFPPPPKKGFAVWTWWAIGGGALVMLAVIVVLAMLVSSAVSSSAVKPSSEVTHTSAATKTNGKQGSSSGLVTLQDALDLGMDMKLTAKLSGDWKDSSDDGTDWSNDKSGCYATATTYQFALGDDDEAATREAHTGIVKVYQEEGATVEDDLSATVPTEDGAEIEFLMSKIVLADGTASYVATRSGVADNIHFSFVLSCYRGDADDAQTALDEVLPKLLIVKD